MERRSRSRLWWLALVARFVDADWLFDARQQCRDLARQMVRLDALAARFEAQERHDRADEVRWDRDEVLGERSRLMREIWTRHKIVTPAR